MKVRQFATNLTLGVKQSFRVPIEKITLGYFFYKPVVFLAVTNIRCGWASNILSIYGVESKTGSLALLLRPTRSSRMNVIHIISLMSF